RPHPLDCRLRPAAARGGDEMKRTNRVAWRVAGAIGTILAAGTVVGIGVMFTDGIQLGSNHYELGWSGKWAIGPDVTDCDLCVCFGSYHLGYITLYTRFPDPNPICVKLRSQASTRPGTARS